MKTRFAYPDSSGTALVRRGLYAARGAGLATAITILALTSAQARAAEPRIVNGVLTSDYPTTGALLYADGAVATITNSGSQCTGTLIGCETFLTAAHCIEDDPIASHYMVFLQHAGFFPVASMATHPAYPSSDATGDIAVLKLGTPVTGIVPSPVQAGSEVPFGTSATIVGFGRSGGGSSDYGLKRAGDVITASCGSVSNDATSLCWDFDAPIGPPGTDSNTCNGDSGGPIYVSTACGLTVAGATSFGVNASCLADDVSADASAFGHLSFIETEGGADLASTSCGAISHVGDSNTTVEGFSGTLSSGSPQAVHSFAVPASTSALRVTMNAIDTGSANFDLYVRRGSAPTTSTFDCAHTGGNQYGSCSFASPVADTWYVLVNRSNGSGAYQVTATTFTSTIGAFPSNGAVCSDGEPCSSVDTCDREHCTPGPAIPNGTPCDDGAVCTPTDQCLAGVCTGSATPRATCKSPPGRSTILLVDKPSPKQDKIVWNWLQGPATTVGEFDDPRDGAPGYTLCVYDSSAGTPAVAVDATAPGGGTCKAGKPCWKATGSPTSPKGYRYSDSDLTPDGILRLTLSAGDAGRSKVGVVGKGATLDLPGPVSPSTYFDQGPSVTVQLVQDDGDCFGARFTTSLHNEPERFHAICGGALLPCN